MNGPHVFEIMKNLVRLERQQRVSSSDLDCVNLADSSHPSPLQANFAQTWLFAILLPACLLASSAMPLLAGDDYGDYSGFSFASSQVDGDLRIGSKTDESEDATTVNITATADDLNGEDDEDGVTLPTGVQLGQTRAMTVNVTNLTTSTAFLNIWIDFNQNGVLTDPGERVASNITGLVGRGGPIGRSISVFPCLPRWGTSVCVCASPRTAARDPRETVDEER